MQETTAQRLDARARDASASSAGDGGWHAATPAQALARLDSDRRGLSRAEAAARHSQCGPNRLPAPRRRAAWQRLLLQFHNLIIYRLLAAGVPRHAT
jgi:magnesium-transporting ATPase (P-type)